MKDKIRYVLKIHNVKTLVNRALCEEIDKIEQLADCDNTINNEQHCKV